MGFSEWVGNGKGMKSPLIERCPCCENELFPLYEKDNPIPDLCFKPIAITHTAHGIRSHTLKWQCLVCGAEWEHGQYEDEAFELEGGTDGKTA